MQLLKVKKKKKVCIDRKETKCWIGALIQNMETEVLKKNGNSSGK